MVSLSVARTDRRCHAKRTLMSWVIVLPKEGWACVAAPIFLLVWHRLFGIQNISKKNNKKKKKNSESRCHTKRRVGAATRAHPSFGMTTAQDIRDLFVWRSPDRNISGGPIQTHMTVILTNQLWKCLSFFSMESIGLPTIYHHGSFLSCSVQYVTAFCGI